MWGGVVGPWGTHAPSVPFSLQSVDRAWIGLRWLFFDTNIFCLDLLLQVWKNVLINPDLIQHNFINSNYIACAD